MMKKIKSGKILTSLLLCILAIFIIIYFQDSNKLSRKCNDEFLYDLESPDSKYKINVYLSSGGSISADSIRIQLKDLKTGAVKNIYWEYPCSDVKVKWISDKKVMINDKILDIETDAYYKYN